MYLQGVQGFTTVKFAIACLLVASILYSMYSFYQMWQMEETFIQKTLCLVVAIASCAIMYIFSSIAVIRQFVMGAGKYNKLRTIVRTQSTSPPPTQITKNIKSAKKIQQAPIDHSHNKVKKHHSTVLGNFPIVNRNDKQSEGRKISRTLSSPITNSFDDTDIFAYQAKQRSLELTNLLRQYEMEINKNNRDRNAERGKIFKARNVLGSILKNQAVKQEDQRKQLIQKLETMFQIHVVENKQNVGVSGFQERRMNHQESNRKIFTDRTRQVLLDEIMKDFANGSLGRTGYKLRSRAAEDAEFRSRMSSSIMKLVNQRIVLDKQINFNCEFGNDKARQKAIEKLKQVASHYLENKNLTAASSMEEFSNSKQMVWILAKHINDLVRPLADECLVFLERDSTEGDRKYYIRWLASKTVAMPHYNQLVETLGTDQAKTVKEYVCVPGADNIASLFVCYLTFLEQEFKAQLLLTPIMQGYVNQVLPIFV